MNIKQHILRALLSVAIAEAVGLLSGWLSGNIAAVYGQLTKPPLSPPDWLFPIAWVLLYALMGIAAYLVYAKRASGTKPALILYGAQLFVNFLWSPVFFCWQDFGLAIAVILLLDLLVVLTISKFYSISKISGWLLMPYLLWLLFASYLCIGLTILN